jgi:hypothetical protein
MVNTIQLPLQPALDAPHLLNFIGVIIVCLLDVPFGYNMSKRGKTKIGRKSKRHAAGAAIAHSNNPAGHAGQQNIFINPLAPQVAQQCSNTPPNQHSRSHQNLTISTSGGSSQNHIRFNIMQDHDSNPPYDNTTTSPPCTTAPHPEQAMTNHNSPFVPNHEEELPLSAEDTASQFQSPAATGQSSTSSTP